MSSNIKLKSHSLNLHVEFKLHDSRLEQNSKQPFVTLDVLIKVPGRPHSIKAQNFFQLSPEIHEPYTQL